MLDTVHWEYLSDEQKTATVELMIGYRKELQDSPETIELLFAELPFYRNISLLQADNPKWPAGFGPVWFLGNTDILYPLDGSSAPVHDANEADPVSVTAENVIDYVRFFCFFVHGDEGPFFVVENLEHPAFDEEKISAEEAKNISRFLQPPEYMGATEMGTHEVTATILYGNALFGSRFAVTANGLIEMIDDEPLAADIPARKIKPNY